MFFDVLHEFPGFILETLTLTDSTFCHLLGLLAVTAFLRLFLPLHNIMTRELSRRNEVADLAEERRCSEFDIFVMAHEFYYGSIAPEKIKQDFITYLSNWPENYILPFYIRNFLAEFERDSSDARHERADNASHPATDKLPGSFTI